MTMERIKRFQNFRNLLFVCLFVCFWGVFVLFLFVCLEGSGAFPWKTCEVRCSPPLHF